MVPEVNNTTGAAHIEGERHVSEVAGPDAARRKKLMYYGYGAACVVIMGLFAWSSSNEGGRKTTTIAEKSQAVSMKSKRAFEEAPPLPNTQQLDAPPEAIPPLPTDMELAGSPNPKGGQSADQTPAIRMPGAGRLIVYTGTASGIVQAVRETVPTRAYADEVPPGGTNELADQMRPSLDAKPVRASVLRNQPYLLTAGTIVPCTLQSAIDSTLAGYVTCVIPQDVVGKSGLTLLDRGTKVIGEFRGGASRGKPRLFVVWTRAETPQGVVIDLNSPAADPVGRAGLQGEVDNRFWDRFGAALLLSTVDGALQAIVTAQSKEGSTTVNTGQASQVVNSILQDSINLPPIIRKHQGDLVSIFVKQDLDFSTVYGLTPVQRVQVAAVRK